MNVGSNRQLAGEYGGRYIDASAGTVTGNYMEIHAVATSILGAVSSNIGNAVSPMTDRMTKGVLQPNGTTVAEPRMDVSAVANAILALTGQPTLSQPIVKA